MRQPESRVTLIKVQISKKTRQVWSLVKLLAALGLFFILVGVAQVAVCKYDHPKRTWQQCLAPMKKGH